MRGCGRRHRRGVFGKFAGILESTQKKLHAAAESIESASKKTRTIERKLRRVEALTRANAPLISFDDQFGLVKINPIAAWSDEEFNAYIAAALQHQRQEARG